MSSDSRAAATDTPRTGEPTLPESAGNDQRGPRVLNRRVVSVPEGAVYVGRPSKWGNPFVIGKHGNREQVVMHYREWLLASGEPTVEQARTELAGKDLVCWCAPEACHADVLLEVANG